MEFPSISKSGKIAESEQYFRESLSLFQSQPGGAFYEYLNFLDLGQKYLQSSSQPFAITCFSHAEALYTALSNYFRPLLPPPEQKLMEILSNFCPTRENERFYANLREVSTGKWPGLVKASEEMLLLSAKRRKNWGLYEKRMVDKLKITRNWCYFSIPDGQNQLRAVYNPVKSGKLA